MANRRYTFFASWATATERGTPSMQRRLSTPIWDRCKRNWNIINGHCPYFANKATVAGRLAHSRQSAATTPMWGIFNQLSIIQVRLVQFLKQLVTLIA